MLFRLIEGIGAAVIILAILVYTYRSKAMYDIVKLAHLLTVAALLVCMLFTVIDLGRPDRFWHLTSGIGKSSLPGSMLSWDLKIESVAPTGHSPRFSLRPCPGTTPRQGEYVNST